MKVLQLIEELQKVHQCVGDVDVIIDDSEDFLEFDGVGHIEQILVKGSVNADASINAGVCFLKIKEILKRENS